MTDSVGIVSYLAAASETERDTLKEQPKFVRAIDELDVLFRTLVTGKSYSKHPACGLLAMNSHAAFLAAAATALRGQAPPTFMIMRSCVESALYGFLIGIENGDGDIWLKRSENLEAAKAKFSTNRAIQKLEPIDPNLPQWRRIAISG